MNTKLRLKNKQKTKKLYALLGNQKDRKDQPLGKGKHLKKMTMSIVSLFSGRKEALSYEEELLSL